MGSVGGFGLAELFSAGRRSMTPAFPRPRQEITVVCVGDEVRLRVSVSGEGPPLLFLFASGGGATIENAQPMLDWFSQAFTVACPDQRGLGLSSVPPGPWTMADYAADAFAVADYLGWERFSVIGISFGGMVALEMAATDPHRLEKLVVWGASPGGFAPSYPLQEIDRLPAYKRRGALDSIVDTRVSNRTRIVPLARAVAGRIRRIAVRAEGPPREWIEERARGLAQQLEARAGHDVIGRLGGLACPTFIGAGVFDGLAPVRNAGVIHDEIPHSELHVYESGHLFFSQPEALGDFLRFLTTERPATD